MEIMANFDVLLIASCVERLPLVVFEARSLGVSVVSTDVGCISKLNFVQTFKNIKKH